MKLSKMLIGTLVVGTVIFRQDLLRVFDPGRSMTVAETRAAIETIKKNYPFVADLPTSLVLGVIETESNFKVFAVSSAKALGLMQLKRPTFETVSRWYNLSLNEPFDPHQNILAGMHYLKRQINALGGNSAGIQAYYTGLAGYRSGRRNLPYLSKVLTAQIKFS